MGRILHFLNRDISPDKCPAFYPGNVLNWSYARRNVLIGSSYITKSYRIVAIAAARPSAAAAIITAPACPIGGAVAEKAPFVAEMRNVPSRSATKLSTFMCLPQPLLPPQRQESELCC